MRRRVLDIQAPLLPRSPGTSCPLHQPWLGRFAAERGGSLVSHAADPRWPLGTSSGAVERPLSRPTSIPVVSGVQGDQSPRGQVERARGGLRPSDSLWCHRGPRQRALSLVCAPFLAVSFPFYSGWLDFVFCHRLPVRPYRLTAVTSRFPRLPTFASKRNTRHAVEGGPKLNSFRERDCLRWRKKWRSCAPLSTPLLVSPPP